MAWAGADDSFFFFRGIRMYQDSNMLEKARESPSTVAIMDSIFVKSPLVVMSVGSKRLNQPWAASPPADSRAPWRFKAIQSIPM